MAKNWARLTEDMAMQYGCSSSKGQALVTISQLCKQADAGICEYSKVGGKVGIYGSIPSCIENGSDFSQGAMRGRLVGLASAYPGLCVALTTHDLNSFSIPSIGALITEIRMA